MEKQFDPMADVPETDDEVMIALTRDDELLTSILRGLYRTHRAQGLTLLEAYEKTLLAHVGAAGTREETK